MTDAGADAGTVPAAADGPTAAPLGVDREPTGLPAVDALLERLAETDHLTADGHLAVYEDVHRGLRAELTSLDAHPASAPRPHDPRS
ncbi:hypothetical protein HHL19_24230 [Streptomyces sp. R302]|uniref:hypothetical protein n=1 Tax=unclassified Streptomyces TaxID=2593676 RepID=UPI00145C5EC5|nr:MULTISPECIES: hypothetical protein [unclassified Streptomyces]NML54411.1 hypothetical protein [Streptomyces sp. R301]NML81673.1 hypothetical protein [Streptomyces sp. R302]